MKESNANTCKRKQSNIICRNSSQNELILPRICEIQKNDVKKYTPRIDSGIAKDINVDKSTESFKCKNWTLSSNCSDEFENAFTNSGIKKKAENTTIELIKVKEGLKKNRTSSTLLSYDRSISNHSNSKISSHYQNVSSDNLNGNTSNHIRRIKSTNKKKDEKLQNHLEKNETTLALNNSKEKLFRRNSNISDYYPRQTINKKTIPKARDFQKGKIFSMDENIQTKKKVLDKSKNQLHRSITCDTFIRPKTVQSSNQSNWITTQIKNDKNFVPDQKDDAANTQKDIFLDECEKNNLCESTYDIDKETGMSNYTFTRIFDWLKEIENCSKIYKTPSELDCSCTSSFEKDKSKESNNECDLSEYGSLDDQIIEYNRVVDKTFHIIHKD